MEANVTNTIAALPVRLSPEGLNKLAKHLQEAKRGMKMIPLPNMDLMPKDRTLARVRRQGGLACRPRPGREESMELKNRIQMIGTFRAKIGRGIGDGERSVWVPVLVFVAYLALPSPAASQVYYGTVYSGASVGVNLNMYGWGVTDVWYTDSYHMAQVSTTLRSPNGRTASLNSGWASNIARADVVITWDGTDLGTYFTTSVHNANCYVMGCIVNNAPSSASAGSPNLNCGTFTRGQTGSCSLGNLPAGASTSDWKFTSGSVTVTPPSNPGTSWSGIVVQSGEVPVKVTSGTNSPTLKRNLTVNARNWHTNPANAAQVANGTFVLLPVPPQPSGPDSGLGAFSESTSDTGANYTTIGSGPNKGYTYYASQPSISTLFQYEINPDLESSTSVFSTKQYGNCGFISWSNLFTQTKRHEYNSTTQSHHAFYKTSINSAAKNPGDFVEQQVAAPGANLLEFGDATRTGLNTRYNQIGVDSQVEPFGVNKSEAGTFLGNINYEPYASCP
jgi:hypothetical protein